MLLVEGEAGVTVVMAGVEEWSDEEERLDWKHVLDNKSIETV